MEGDDDYQKQTQTAEERTKDKYADETANYSARDQGLGEGVVKERGIKDCLCLIVYVVFLGAMVFCTIYGNRHGRINKLIAPLDGDNTFCGIEPAAVVPYPRLFIPEFTTSVKASFKSAVCTDKCPKKGDTIKYYKKGSAAASSLVAKYDTKAVLNYCFPASAGALSDNAKAIWLQAKAEFLNNPVGKYFNDLYLSSTSIYISFFMSVIYSFVFIYLMSAFAETIAWICVGLAQLSFIFATIACWMYRSSEVARQAASHDWTKQQNEDSHRIQTLALVATIVFAIVSCLFLTCIICGFRSLKLAIDVIDASADFLAETKRIILVPILYFFVSIIVFSTWVVGFMNVASLNKIKADTDLIPQMKDLIWEDSKIKYMALFMFFGLLWIMAWIKYTCNFICMVSASTYYFNSGPNKEGQAEVGLGFKFAHINHTGSIAFGSFIIAVIQFVRFIFLYVAKQAAKASGDNAAVKMLIACGDCILRCIEKICDYLNTAAFAYMAISGDSFCGSAWNGFLLNVKHMLKFTFANFIAKIFTLLGKVGIVVGNLFSLYFIMKWRGDLEEISSLLGPLILVGVVSFFTASIFLGLFDTAVMSLMTCLAVDLDVHDGQPEFGPPTFHDGVSKVEQTMGQNKPNTVE